MKRAWSAVLFSLLIFGVTAGRMAKGAEGETQPVVEDTVGFSVRLRALAKDLDSNVPAKQKQARRELLALQEEYVRILLQGSDRDEAADKRVAQVLHQASASLAMGSVLAELPRARRSKLLRLRDTHPRLVANAFSLEGSRRVAAMKAIKQLKDPNALAEELVLVGLRDRLPSVVSAALQTARSGRYKSDVLIDRLSDLVVVGVPDGRQWLRAGRRMIDTTGESFVGPLAYLAVEALVAIGSTRPVPVLVAVLLRDRGANVIRDAQLAGAIADLGDKAAIPPLIRRLDRTEIVRRATGKGLYGPEKTVLTIAPADAALVALVRLTGQRPVYYDLIPDMHFSARKVRGHGFAKEAYRRQAIKRFLKWWDEHKGKPPYRDLKPLKIPDVGDLSDAVKDMMLRVLRNRTRQSTTQRIGRD